MLTWWNLSLPYITYFCHTNRGHLPVERQRLRGKARVMEVREVVRRGAGFWQFYRPLLNRWILILVSGDDSSAQLVTRRVVTVTSWTLTWFLAEAPATRVAQLAPHVHEADVGWQDGILVCHTYRWQFSLSRHCSRFFRADDGKWKLDRGFGTHLCPVYRASRE